MYGVNDRSGVNEQSIHMTPRRSPVALVPLRYTLATLAYWLGRRDKLDTDAETVAPLRHPREEGSVGIAAFGKFCLVVTWKRGVDDPGPLFA